VKPGPASRGFGYFQSAPSPLEPHLDASNAGPYPGWTNILWPRFDAGAIVCDDDVQSFPDAP
jgi:hypothetical protein